MSKRKCKCKEKTLVKILPAQGTASNVFNQDILRMTDITSPKEMDEYVVLESHVYQEIFGQKKVAANNNLKRLSVVKICFNGKCIHRAYRSASATNFTADYVALTGNSIYLLSSEKQIPTGSKVYLSKGCWWFYYWNNPNSAVRMSFQVGVIGILVSIVVGICTLIIDSICC